MLQQHRPFTVCAEGCEAAEERSDDEVRTSQVPERSEGKTRVIRKWSLPFTVLKRVRGRTNEVLSVLLQQYLPFTVLKLSSVQHCYWHELTSCNSTYRLRYWNPIKS